MPDIRKLIERSLSPHRGQRCQTATGYNTAAALQHRLCRLQHAASVTKRRTGYHRRRGTTPPPRLQHRGGITLGDHIGPGGHSAHLAAPGSTGETDTIGSQCRCASAVLSSFGEVGRREKTAVETDGGPDFGSIWVAECIGCRGRTLRCG